LDNFSSVLNLIGCNNNCQNKIEQSKPFDLNLFLDELHQYSETKNRDYHLKFAKNINAYDLTSSCIAQVLFKLYKTPVNSFADKWLPILMRGFIGQAVHNFIQSNTNQFSELERTLKVPSLRFSGRLDGLIGSNVLVEIKSCPYNDYIKVIKSQKPRSADFDQIVIYRYMLHNHLEEIKNNKENSKNNVPSLDKYNINKIQFIYVAHDLISQDIEDFSLAIKKISALKKQLSSKNNKFFFMTSLIIDVNDQITKPFEERLLGKLKRINNYLQTNRFPTKDDPYIDKKSCYFCLYRNICQLQG